MSWPSSTMDARAVARWTARADASPGSRELGRHGRCSRAGQVDWGQGGPRRERRGRATSEKRMKTAALDRSAHAAGGIVALVTCGMGLALTARSAAGQQEAPLAEAVALQAAPVDE